MEETPRHALIGVGANLGDRWGTIRAALGALAREPGILSVDSSSVYETDPVDVREQPPFLNLAAAVATALSPEELLEALHRLESAAGRRRECEVRWGPRPLDLDLLLFEGEVRTGAALTLPHPRLWERAFVTVPLRELVARHVWWNGPAWEDARKRLAAATSAQGVRLWNP